MLALPGAIYLPGLMTYPDGEFHHLIQPFSLFIAPSSACAKPLVSIMERKQTFLLRNEPYPYDKWTCKNVQEFPRLFQTADRSVEHTRRICLQRVR
jgi:hypothetical protein